MPEKSQKKIDINFYLGMLHKRRYLALAVALVIVSLFTWGGFFIPKSYVAISTVFVQRSAVMGPLLKGVGTSDNMEERIRTLREQILSRNLLDRVIKKLDLDLNAKNPEKYEALIESVRKNITITSKAYESTTDLFSVSYSGPNPKTVRDIVNTVVGEFISDNIGLRRSDTYNAFEFIQNQVLEYKQKLDESDTAIRQFREKNPQMLPESESSMVERAQTFQAAGIESQMKLKELIRKADTIRKQLSGEKELTVAMVTGGGSPQARLNELNSQMSLLMAKYTEKYPEVIKVKGEIEELKKQIAQGKASPKGNESSETSMLNPIYQGMKEELSKTEAEIETLKIRTSELSKQQQGLQSRLGSMPKENEEWSKLQRDRGVYQKIYDELLQKLENARVSKDSELTDKTETLKVVDPAVLPVFPAKPNIVMLILVGLALGIGGGIGLVIWLESINNTFKDDDTVEAVLKLPVLASIQNNGITEAEAAAIKRKDKRIFIASAGYLCVILIVLANELLLRLGITLIRF